MYMVCGGVRSRGGRRDSRAYDVTDDGSRFLVNRTEMEVAVSRFTVFINVLPELTKTTGRGNEADFRPRLRNYRPTVFSIAVKFYVARF